MSPQNWNRTASLLREKDRSDFRMDSCSAQREAIKAGKILFYGLTHGHYPGIKLPPELLPGLRSLGFWDAVGMQDWCLEPHRNNGLEIVLLETGKMDFAVDELFHQLAPGTLTVTRPWQLHCHGTSHVGPGRLHWLILDVEALRPAEKWHWPDWIMLMPEDIWKLTERLQENSRSVWIASSEIISSFQRMAGCLVHPELDKQTSQLILSINQLLLSLLREMESPFELIDPKQNLTEHTIEQFLAGLNMNQSRLSESWTLETMAEHCGVGCTVLVKYCNRITNTTPMDYLNRCRLEWAATELIRCPGATITEISFRSGFSSSPYFSTQFRRRFGASPSEYRGKHLK